MQYNWGMDIEKLEFKKINPQDYGELLFKMDVKTFCREYDYPSNSVETTLDYLKNCIVYLVEIDKVTIGLFAYSEKDNEVEVKQIIVLPEFQNKGYGKKIVKKILELCKNKKVWLVTHPKNTGAIIVYLKNGFELSGWKENYYEDGQPRIVFWHIN